MKTVWEKYQGKYDDIMDFSEGYKTFMDNAKTEREFVSEGIKLAEKCGFKNFEKVKKLKPNDKVYVNNRNKSLFLFVVGKKDMEEGINILGAHIDSPRLDIKQHPLYETDGLVLMDTHYYGGIKNYQWVAKPLALHGVVAKKDGSVVEVKIGEDPSDPVIGIGDLLPHLGKDQMSKSADKVIEGENLDLLVASIPKMSKKKDEKDLVKQNLLDLLKDKYGFEEEDFVSAELEVVPAGKARDYGLDRSMVLCYGQDDRVCGYTSLKAVLDVDHPEKTTCCILSDKEEVGSIGATGAQSAFFKDTVAEMLEKSGEYSEMKLRRLFRNSCMLSSDVSAGFDPLFPEVDEKKNTAFLGSGICFNKYLGGRGKSGSNDASAEYIARIRKVMDDNKIVYQTGEIGKVDQGGGGTIAYILANLNMDVIDAGIAVQNMHSCYEVSSKADVYEAYLAYKTFIKEM